jgi:hypothetical protein
MRGRGEDRMTDWLFYAVLAVMVILVVISFGAEFVLLGDWL